MGDEVTVSESHLQNEVRNVVSIKHKYLHALHESMERFQELFPEHKAMTKVSFDESEDPNEQFALIFESVSQRQDQILQVEELYITNRLPLAVVAKFTGSHPIDVWRSFVSRKKTPFNVCIGTFEERSQAFKLIEENKNGYIVDPITLFAICALEIKDQILSFTGKLGVTQSTLDLLQKLIDERSVNTEGYLSLSKEGDQYYKHEITKEDIEKDIDQTQEVLSWAQSECEIISAVGSQDIPVSGVKISETMSPAFIDTMLAAQGSGRILLSDDMHLRMWAKGLFGVSGVWLQTVMMAALDKNVIEREVYYESVITLVNSNYCFTSIDANILLYLAEKQDWVANQNFERVASIWVLYKEHHLFMMLNILIKGRPDELYVIINQFWRNANRINSGLDFINVTNQRQYEEALYSWCEGHFIKLT